MRTITLNPRQAFAIREQLAVEYLSVGERLLAAADPPGDATANFAGIAKARQEGDRVAAFIDQIGWENTIAQTVISFECDDGLLAQLTARALYHASERLGEAVVDGETGGMDQGALNDAETELDEFRSLIDLAREVWPPVCR
jgi:hypothetical protein